MEIHVRDDSRLAEIWLSNAEKRDKELRERLKPLYQKYKMKNYTLVVFESGEEDLWDLTSGLLCNHRRCAAQREMELEQRKGLAMFF